MCILCVIYPCVLRHIRKSTRATQPKSTHSSASTYLTETHNSSNLRVGYHSCKCDCVSDRLVYSKCILPGEYHIEHYRIERRKESRHTHHQQNRSFSGVWNSSSAISTCHRRHPQHTRVASTPLVHARDRSPVKKISNRVCASVCVC